jgi:hypothetical protein
MVDFIPFKNRKIDRMKDVEVYRNLHMTKSVYYSIRQNGLVVGHAHRFVLSSCKFVVREKGRLRTIKEKRKNVHAFVKGRYLDFDAAPMWLNRETPHCTLSYNPYEDETFMLTRHIQLIVPKEVKEIRHPIKSAIMVTFNGGHPIEVIS